MKTLLLLTALLLTRAAVAQVSPAGEAPGMLADVQDEVSTAHLKPLTRQQVTLKPAAAGRPATLVTLTAENLTFQLNLAEVAKARSTSTKVQQKYTRALQYLRVILKEGRSTIELNQPATRDLEHLLAAWALPQGRVAAITWQGQPVTAYTVERYGGGPNQAAYPEGQVFYFYERERPAGFYVYMNVPKTK